jgi:hypothetical protein
MVLRRRFVLPPRDSNQKIDFSVLSNLQGGRFVLRGQNDKA